MNRLKRTLTALVFVLSLFGLMSNAQIKTLKSTDQTITVTTPNGPNTIVNVAVPLNLSNKGPGNAIQGNASNAAGLVGTSVAPGQNLPLGTPFDANCPCGVFGSSTSEFGMGLAGSSRNIGIYGDAPFGVVGVSEGSTGSGVLGFVLSGSNTAVEGDAEDSAGLWASSSTGNGVIADSGNVAVLGRNFTNRDNVAYLATRCCAADLYGEVYVHGVLKKYAGQFQIDHPLDPTHKYLNHAFVESPDMMNIYNGNVTLDAKGIAQVKLPDWFEALNQDFRYQLTAIGKPGPNLYVSREIVKNTFEIAGGHPGGKVSWQVTGVRHDVYANAHRMEVEEDKPAAEVGTYLTPELYGMGPERGSRSVRYPDRLPAKRIAKTKQQ